MFRLTTCPLSYWEGTPGGVSWRMLQYARQKLIVHTMAPFDASEISGMRCRHFCAYASGNNRWTTALVLANDSMCSWVGARPAVRKSGLSTSNMDETNSTLRSLWLDPSLLWAFTALMAAFCSSLLSVAKGSGSRKRAIARANLC